ncbi:reverse transcriptase domain-containing protein [Tanacetum coccineum]
MVMGRIWLEHTLLRTVRRGDMLGHYPTTTSANSTMRGSGQYRSDCPKLKNHNRGNKSRNKPNETRGRAYALGGANPDANIFTDTFLLNNHYARMLFDSGADRIFVSTAFSVLLDIVPSTLDVSLLAHSFDIDLMPIELGSFNVVIGMDWLLRYHVVIICD